MGLVGFNFCNKLKIVMERGRLGSINDMANKTKSTKESESYNN